MLWAPISRYRLMVTISFHGTRTTGCVEYGAAACSCESTIGSSLGECSVSSSSQSKPDPATTSTAKWLDRLHHKPICGLPALRARLKLLAGNGTRFPTGLVLIFWCVLRRYSSPCAVL